MIIYSYFLSRDMGFKIELQGEGENLRDFEQFLEFLLRIHFN